VLKAIREKARGGAGRVGPVKLPNVQWPEPIRVPTPREGGDGKAVAGDVKESSRGKLLTKEGAQS